MFTTMGGLPLPEFFKAGIYQVASLTWLGATYQPCYIQVERVSKTQTKIVSYGMQVSMLHLNRLEVDDRELNSEKGYTFTEAEQHERDMLAFAECPFNGHEIPCLFGNEITWQEARDIQKPWDARKRLQEDDDDELPF